MSLLDDLLAKAGLHLGRQGALGQATDAVVHDRFDARLFAELLDQAPALRRLVDDLGADHDHAEDLVRDVLMLLWQGDPKQRTAEEMAAGHLLNHGAVTDLWNAPETAQARIHTRGDRYAAAVATLAVADTLSAYRAEREQAARAAQAAEEQQQRAERINGQLRQAISGAEAAGWPPIGPPSPAQQAAALALANTLRTAQTAAAAADDDAADAGRAAGRSQARLRRPLREALGRAADRLNEERTLLCAWGVGDGQVKRMGLAERAALAARLAGTRLARFAQLIGRFRTMATAQRARDVEHGRSQVVGAELSGDLSRVLPAELARLADDVLEADFTLRLAEGRLLSRKVQGRQRTGGGAIVCCVDTSQSMRSPLDGHGPADAENPSREAWAKACALALLDHARSRGRDFVAIHFSSAGQQQVWRFPDGQGRIEDVVAMAEHCFDGGTDFQAPLDLAADALQTDLDRPGNSYGDVVFITDDVCDVDARWLKGHLERKRALGFRTFGIALGAGCGRALSAVSDDVRRIADLTDPSKVADVFQTLR